MNSRSSALKIPIITATPPAKTGRRSSLSPLSFRLSLCPALTIFLTSFFRPLRVIPVSLQPFSMITLLIARAVPEVPIMSFADSAFRAAI